MDLTVIWFCIIAFFFIGYFVLDGFDFGVGMALPIVSRDDTDRRILVNTIGPIWDLNETWVIVGGAAMFAAFPEWYASVFSGFYLPLLLILVALILRGVSFEYRHQRDGLKWKRMFDTFIVIGSAVPALLWGVAFANIVHGVALDGQHNYVGTMFDLLNPYGLLGGLTTLTLFFCHGLMFLGMKTTGELRARCRTWAMRSGILVAVLAIAFLTWTFIDKQSMLGLVFSVIAVLAFVVAFVANLLDREKLAFACTCLTIAGAVAALFASLFPNVLPSTLDPAGTLTIENASSTPYTLQVMTWVAVICMPFVLLYQGWTYWAFRKRVTREQIEAAAH